MVSKRQSGGAFPPPKTLSMNATERATPSARTPDARSPFMRLTDLLGDAKPGMPPINISVGEQLLPAVIQKALTGTSLLFIGYRIADTNFRVLLRSLLRFMEQGVKRTHYAVMLPPPGSEDVRQKAQDYLTAYYDQIDVRVFWGDAAAFFRELNERAKADV